ncbi:Oidioi.mRNA.OKI2018_I69.chr2.g4368.t1.cds [Oikopleura dioica]|uniref:Oidioi.mRNA.OKI2018_I69.chr2.g4368.t1.cds n=1 Tax=Oikopleura dioica TaxID=34765 RepID=A0ABN7SYP9_OIKDI|nr:Oidioi.mRNA.OKI2018_I69.chr2.g4368.t1.cds [Oikopleura dioica]
MVVNKAERIKQAVKREKVREELMDKYGQRWKNKVGIGDKKSGNKKKSKGKGGKASDKTKKSKKKKSKKTAD